ncbi:MAG: TldD/PmbA family protein [Candidatus Liptonbacteria bacterium]|nr:TldD/PmbA family protein [Candidatus Liptonbacteria bacterium]
MGAAIESQYALAYARKLGASYADLRVTRRRAERAELTDGVSPGLSGSNTAGLGIRVLVSGARGFSSIQLDGTPGRASLRELVREAVELAKVSAKFRASRIRLAPLRGFSPGKVDCRSSATTPYHGLAPRERMRVLREWDNALHGRMVAQRTVAIETDQCDYYFAQVERGEFREIHQNRRGCELDISVTAIGHGEVQTRSRLFAGTVGYSFPLTEAVEKECRRLRVEATRLLRAPECRENRCDLIILPDQFALHAHELVHGMEGDRIGDWKDNRIGEWTEGLDYEATYMGGAIMSDPRFLAGQGEFRLANKCVTLLADATLPGGYGTFNFDDDGVPAANFPLLEQGVFQNFLHSRETAGMLARATKNHELRRSPGIGCSRASDYSRMPLVRMTNTVLVPGEATLKALVAGVDRGLIIATPYSWSMYPFRRGFIFGCEIGWLIKGGKIVGMVRNPAYRGGTVKFWSSIRAVGCESEIHNQPNCGKGQPGQAIGTGHQTPPVLVEGVQVFSRRKFRGGKKGGKKCS